VTRVAEVKMSWKGREDSFRRSERREASNRRQTKGQKHTARIQCFASNSQAVQGGHAHQGNGRTESMPHQVSS